MKEFSTSKTKKALIACLADASGNPRPRRAIALCKEQGYDVHVMGLKFKDPVDIDGFYEIKTPSMRLDQKILRKIIGLAGVLFSSRAMLKALIELRWKLSSIKQDIKNTNFDIIIVEDLYLLPFAFEIKCNAKIIFDAREFYPEQLGHSFLFRITERNSRIKLCRDYLPRCDAVMTVSYGLAERYQKDFGVNCDLIFSVPAFSEREPSALSQPIKMVHHGVANPNRRLENMIDMFRHLDHRFSLDFYLVGSHAYIERLRERAKPYPNIRFLEPVKLGNIVEMLSRYDIGLCYLEDTTFNLRHSLPNKFFECIQARLAIAIGPSPDMSLLVEHYDCGIASSSFDPETFAATLNALTGDDIARYKQGSHLAAQELCWEKEKIKYLGIIDRITRSEKSGLSDA